MGKERDVFKGGEGGRIVRTREGGLRSKIDAV